jgi:hypothetical protein
MAASVSVLTDLGGVGGGAAVRIVQVTMDSSYATDGEAITANACRLGSITTAMFFNNGGWTPEWDQANLKIKVRGQDGDTTGAPVALSEADNATNIATIVFTGIVIGTP